MRLNKINLTKYANLINSEFDMNLDKETIKTVVGSITIGEIRRARFETIIERMREDSKMLSKKYKKDYCESCKKKKKKLMFHHRLPIELMSEEMNKDPTFYKTLCLSCHRQIHAKWKTSDSILNHLF